MNRIGTVEILRMRVYNLDAETHDDLCTTVIVEPGLYDLFEDGMTTWWVMTGQINKRGMWRLGDGAFAAITGDEPSGIEVTFPSKRFGSDEWAALIAGPEFTDGPARRLRVLLDAEVRS